MFQANNKHKMYVGLKIVIEIVWWNTIQKWKWKITVCATIWVKMLSEKPAIQKIHIEEWFYSYGVQKRETNLWCLLSAWLLSLGRRFGVEAGWGHKEIFEMLNDILISWSGCCLCEYFYFVVFNGTGQIWFVYSSLCMLYFNKNVYLQKWARIRLYKSKKMEHN